MSGRTPQEKAYTIAHACESRCRREHNGPPVTWQQAQAAVEHPLTGLKPDELRQVVAVLAARLAELRRHMHQESAHAAMLRIAQEVRLWESLNRDDEEDHP